MFIEKHKSNEKEKFLAKVTFQPYMISEDLLRYKNFLAEQTQELRNAANKVQVE